MATRYCPISSIGMDLAFAGTTVASMDAGAESTRMYSRRVVPVNAKFMSGTVFDVCKSPEHMVNIQLSANLVGRQ